ncbi:MAG: transporter associated domain-containing protein, partial [Mycobacterium sp.]
GLVLQELGHIPVAGEVVDLAAFKPDGLADTSAAWQAKVIRMDGRRIDLVQLTKLGPRADSGGDR